MEARGIEFRTVLRLRPFLKKEREDPTLLEPMPGDTSTVVLHPPPPKQGDILSPSSELVRQIIQPQGVISQDVDFRLDHVWPVDATQDKIYFAMGLPMALASMEPLKVDTTNPSSPRAQVTNNLVIGIGLSGSGKTYTCWGGSTIQSKRKQETDGLVPRIIDSMFSQSKHHICNDSNRGRSFAVNISTLLVKQHKRKSDDGTLYDLLQPVASRTVSIASSVSSLTLSTAGKSPIIQNIKCVQGGGPLNKSVSGGTSTLNSNDYSVLDEPVFVEQDSQADFHVINGQVRTCRTNEEAREALKTAMAGAYRLSSTRHQSHVLITMKPVLMDKAGANVVRTGGTVAVLDMAAYTVPTATSQTSNRGKESLLTARDDAHSALCHCLRTLHENESIRGGQPLQQQEESGDDISPPFQRTLSFKKVPYRQHMLTMVLQPLLTKKSSEKSVITVMMTAYPGHRDYLEKKTLLDEVKMFRCQIPRRETATTGLKQSSSRKKERNSKNCKSMKPIIQHPNRSRSVPSCDADDEGSLEGIHGVKKLSPMQVLTAYTVENPVAVAPGISNYVSRSYSSDDLYEKTSDRAAFTEPLPPPVAPSYEILMRASLSSSVISPKPSAPIEPSPAPPASAIYALPAKKQATLSDFPGVSFLSPAVDPINSFCSEESSPPCPPQRPTAVGSLTVPSTASRDGSEEEAAAVERVFSPMKTFNKVVHASKKKGQQVLDKMSKLSYDALSNETGATDSDHRLAAVENQNKRLLEENDHLRASNERLLQENEELRSQLTELKCEPQSGNDSYHSGSRVDQRDVVDVSLLRHIAAVGGNRLDSSPSHYHPAWKPHSPTLNRSILENYKKFQQSSN
jgi:hypothetical protein